MELPRSGIEWLVDAQGCALAALRSQATLAALFDEIVADLGLNPLGEAQWHGFPGEGGVTGLLMLSESHLSVHSFPEMGLATLNLYCCRPREEWPWEERLAQRLGARRVVVRRIERSAE